MPARRAALMAAARGCSMAAALDVRCDIGVLAETLA